MAAESADVLSSTVVVYWTVKSQSQRSAVCYELLDSGTCHGGTGGSCLVNVFFAPPGKNPLPPLKQQLRMVSWKTGYRMTFLNPVLSRCRLHLFSNSEGSEGSV